MSQNLVVSYATAKVRVPATVVAAAFHAALQALNADGAPIGSPVTADNLKPVVTFVDVADGDYSVTSSRVDITGAVLGKEIVDVITIAAGQVTHSQLVDGVASSSFALVSTNAPEAAPAG